MHEQLPRSLRQNNHIGEQTCRRYGGPRLVPFHLKFSRSCLWMPIQRRSTSTSSYATPRSIAKHAAPGGSDCALVWSVASRLAIALSYWALWFALVADADFDGSWERFVTYLQTQKAKGLARDLAECKLSHLQDLQQRLRQAEVAFRDIMAPADRKPIELRRARHQVRKQEPRAS